MSNKTRSTQAHNPAYIVPMIQKILPLVALILLTACGFTPVYGTLGTGQDYGNEDLMALVRIDNIPDREGQMLRNALIDRINRNGYPANPQFVLDVEALEENLTDLDVTKDSDSTRGQLRLSTTIQLRNIATKEIVLKRNLHAITSYNILASEFTNRVAEQNARQNAITDLANQITLQLNLYFKRM